MPEQVTCTQCGKEFKKYFVWYRLEKYLKGEIGVFCSKSCRGLSERRQVSKTCEICNEAFEVKASHADTRFCSRGCSAEWKRTAYSGENNPKWSGGVEKARARGRHRCKPCKLKFGSREDLHLHCSQVHNRVKHTPEFVTFVCSCCSKSIVMSKKKASRRKCCSVTCANIVRFKNQRRKNTDIEQNVENWLKEQDFPWGYKTQVPIGGIAVVDFLVGEETIIECDGRYWHTKPGKLEKDLIRDNKLIALGYTVIRINEQELKDCPIDQIMFEKSYLATCHNMRRVSWQKEWVCKKKASSVIKERRHPSITDDLREGKRKRLEGVQTNV